MYNSDADLIARLQQNDQQAFAQLFDMFYSALLYFADRIIADREEAEDIVLNTFSKYWRICKNFETLDNIKAFLYITTRNNCLNYLRYRQRLKEFQKEYAGLFDQDDVSERLKIESEYLRKIHAAVNKLPTHCREIFTLTYFKGLKASEIAKQLKIAVSTVTSQRARAIKLLRQALWPE